MDDPKYREHEVFKRLTEYSDFYEGLSDTAMNSMTEGISAPFNIDTYAFTSIRGTIDSIKETLEKGRIGDSYSLLRKYFDSILINIYSNLILLDNFNIENFVVDQIDKWVKGQEKMPGNNIISPYILSSKRLTAINTLLCKDKRYAEIKQRCNDYMHYNFYHNVIVNDNQVHLENRIQILDKFLSDIDNAIILHFAYLFTVKDYYMSSSDYADYLDIEEEPPTDSQYWVAPFIQNMFDSLIKTKRPDIATEIKNSTQMKLE